jgi:hypothetical protein|tara:strand:- start:1833 stop:2018 length:186 start_codon:yes stop_codon:yes gene_type:complete
MCSKQTKAIHYHFTSAYTREEVGIVCRQCCIREYYGTRFRQSKRYNRDLEEKSLFGVKNEI